MIALETGNIGYIVYMEGLKGQQKWQQGGNKVATFPPRGAIDDRAPKEIARDSGAAKA